MIYFIYKLYMQYYMTICNEFYNEFLLLPKRQF